MTTTTRICHTHTHTHTHTNTHTATRLCHTHTHTHSHRHTVMQVEYIVDGNSVYITNLFVPEEQRGCGLAVKALHEVCNEAYRLHIPFIKVDDMSDRYRQKNNIYLKAGFVYMDPTSGCEMVARTSTVSRYLKKNISIISTAK